MKGKTDTLLNKMGGFLTRIWVWLPVSLGILFVATLVLLPFAIRQGVEGWLVDQGAEEVRLEDVDFNLFLGLLTVRNLQFRTDGKRSLVLPHATVRFALLPLWRRQLVIQELYLRDTSLAIEQSADGRWRFAGLGGAPAGKEQPSAWHVNLEIIRVTNSEITYTSPDLKGKAGIDRGDVTLSFGGAAGSAFPVSGLRVQLNGNLHAERANPPWTFDARLNADLQAEAPARDTPGPWRMRGKGEILGLDFKSTGENLRAFSAEQLTVEDLAMTGLDQIAIGTLGAGGLVLAQPLAREAAPPLMKASQLRVSGLRYQSGKSMAITEISVGGFNLVATHEKRGTWYGLTPLRSFLKAFESPGPKTPAMPVRIGTITIQEPGQIELSDYAIEPAYRNLLTLTAALLTGIDTSSPPASPTDVAVKARLGKYSTAELHGQIRAFNPEMAASLLLKLNEFDMPTLSAYSARMLGYRVVSGQMGGELDLQIADGRLDGKSKLAFAKLEMKPRDEASAEKLKARLSVPLETGLAMLRDKNNNVNLEVNVSGEVGDPKFDLTDAINQALTKAMRTASVSYLKHYFQPYGTLITVAELAGKALQLRLDPLVYVAGTASLSPDTGEYLDKIGKLLQERGKLGVKLCGKSVTADDVAEEAARALASRRAEMLKDLLVREYGIATDRLFLCEPEFDKEAGAKPRVELLF